MKTGDKVVCICGKFTTEDSRIIRINEGINFTIRDVLKYDGEIYVRLIEIINPLSGTWFGEFYYNSIRFASKSDWTQVETMVEELVQEIYEPA